MYIGPDQNGAADDAHPSEDDHPSSSKKTDIKAPAPNLYRYNLQIVHGDSDGESSDSDSDEAEDSGKRDGVSSSDLSRHKSLAPRPKLKLFLKNSCTAQGDRLSVKQSLINDFRLNELQWSEVLVGPFPEFPKTPMLKRPAGSAQASSSQTNTPNGVDKPSKKQSAKQQTPSSTATSPTSTGKKKKQTKNEKAKQQKDEKTRKAIEKQQEELKFVFNQARRFNVDDVERWEQTDKLLTEDEIGEFKTLVKEHRDHERERAREEKRRERELVLEWKKPRDDLACDDLKPLPDFDSVNLPDWLPPEAFGDFLSVLEFFWSFGDQLGIKEHHTSNRVTFDDLMQAITSRETNSPLTDLFNILLRAKADRGDEEDGDEANLDNKEELAVENCDLDHRKYSTAIREATVKHERVRLIHGQSARHLPVDAFTLSEVLRLQIATAGYYTGQVTARFRYTHRGGFRCWDDDGLLLKIKHPELFDRLNKETIFDFSPTERLLLLKMLCDQLLGYYGFRQSQDEKTSKLVDLKKDLKNLRAWDQQQEKESKNALLVREHEAEQIEEHGEKAKEEFPPRPKPSKATIQIKAWLRGQREGGPASRRGVENVTELLFEGVAYDELEMDEISEVRQVQRERVETEENRILKQIFDAQSKCGLTFLGRDRAFRSYYYSENVPALLVATPVEADELGGCCEEATSLDKVAMRPDDDDLPLMFDRAESDLSIRKKLLACTADEGSCPVHNPSLLAKQSWKLVASSAQLDELIDSCNPRGFRESDLADNLRFGKQRLLHLLEQSAKSVAAVDDGWLVTPKDPIPSLTADWSNDLRDLLLELEDKVYTGGIGNLKVESREKWRDALQSTGDVTTACKTVAVMDKEIYTDEELQRLGAVSKLAIALLHIAQGVTVKFLRLPFAAPPNVSDDNGNEKAVDGPNMPTETFILWQETLLQCETMSAVALYYSTLEPGILWSKSRLQAKCRTCRKKGTADSSVLCAACDRCYHLQCVRPALGKLPAGDWLCADCKSAETAKQKRKAKGPLVAKNGWNDELFDDEHSSGSGAGSDFTPDCAACGASVRGNNRSTKCADCGEVYHFDCAQLRTAPKGEWLCRECRSSAQSSRAQTPEQAIQTTTTSSGRVVRKIRFLDAYADEQPQAKKRPGKRSAPAENGYHEEDSDDESAAPRKRRRRDEKLADDAVRSVSMGLRDGSWGRSKDILKQCESIIKETMRQDDAWVFCE
uniref:Uncharacterized protein n=1 Tax=Plectus sambesii TaxID=2011161 RepID=A0A914X6T8_9BILA